MARARNIKPGFFKNDELAQCEHGARLLFAGLWCLADREGRLEDRPVRIKGELFPYDNCDIDRWLRQLHAKQFIARYEIEGRKYIQVNNFGKHQNPHCKEPASTIPAPCAHHAGPADSGFLIPDSGFLIPDSGFSDCDTPVSAPVDPSLRAWLDWWNSLARERLVLAGIDAERPSKAVVRAWSRFAKDQGLRALLSDRVAVRREIELSSFVKTAGWFTLPKLFGGTNKTGELIAEKLMQGAFRDAKPNGRESNDPRGNKASYQRFVQELEHDDGE